MTLVDFWAPGCGPCRKQGPIMQQIAARLDGKAKIARINVDQGQQSAAEYGIRSIPTLIIFKDGEPLEKFVGVHSEEQLLVALEQAL